MFTKACNFFPTDILIQPQQVNAINITIIKRVPVCRKIQLKRKMSNNNIKWPNGLFSENGFEINSM